VIEVRGLTKEFGTLRAVDDLTFTVGAGQLVGFLGPNGAGKTTTLRMLLGLVAPTAGIATIDGLPYRELPDPVHTVGAALEAAAFHPGRTARNALHIHALAGTATPSRVSEVLDLVDLADAADRRVGGFSLGMRQRLGLAAALLHEPAVLVLDEPANGLDPEGVRWLRELLRGLGARGRTVLVSSHILAEIAQIADSVVILDRGRLVTHSSLAELVAGIGSRILVRAADPSRLAALLAAAGAAVTPDGDRLAVSGATPEDIGRFAAEHRIAIYEMSSAAGSLEDVFLRLTGGTAR
jgi:ABC-2 type transport system ATP-binding protein